MKSRSLFSDLADYWAAPAVFPQLPVWRQLVEMALLYFLRQMGPRYYLQARWGRKSIPFREKWQHINRAEYRDLVSRLNPSAYQKSSQHKLIEKSVLTLQNLPTPEFIAYVHLLRGKCRRGNPVRNSEQLVQLLQTHVNERICFKPVEGFGGSGFAGYEVLRFGDSVRLLRNEGEAAISPEEWWSSKGQDPEGFVIESYLVQHPDMGALNKSSVNTIRVMVGLQSDRWVVMGALLRVGRAGHQVDNISSGGIACRVDVKTGQIKEAFDPRNPGHTLTCHPDSGNSFERFQIPFWDAAKALAAEALAAFPNMRIAGLDIAITPTGPTIIELNVMAEYLGCAMMDLPLKAYVEPLLSNT